MLRIEKLRTGYFKKEVIHGVDLNLGNSDIIAIIGPNGSGKSTILKAIAGVIPVWQGEIYLNDRLINNNSPQNNMKSGLVFSPQGKRVFDELSVAENLKVGGLHLSKLVFNENLENIFEIFPILKERHKQIAGRLSGGERQMLAICRALISNPRIMLLDEPSMGLSPLFVGKLFEKLQELSVEKNISMLIVEQKVNYVLKFSNRIYGLKLGRIVLDESPKNLKDDKEVFRQLFL